MKPARFQLSLFDALTVTLAPPSTSPALQPPVPLPAPATPAHVRPTTAPAIAAVSRTRALVDAIQRHLPGARVVITDNRTVLLSQSQRDGVRTVRAHQMFLDAPEPVRAAVAHFLAHGDKKSGAAVDAFVDAQSHLLALAARPLPDDAHLGTTHDLGPLFAELESTYFAATSLGGGGGAGSGTFDGIELGWGQAGTPCRRRRRSITFGSWDARARRIVIHPVLDQPEVPRLAVARVLHHEMVHARVGDERSPRGTRIVHGRTFRAEEARFAHAADADAWFDQHLDALLRWRPGQPLAARRT